MATRNGGVAQGNDDIGNSQLFMCSTCSRIFDNWEEASNSCPNHKSTAYAKPSMDEPEQLKWNVATTKLLLESCAGVQINGKVGSKQDQVHKWQKILLVYKQHGYSVTDWEVLRKKWYRMVERYKVVRDRKRTSGEGSVVWEWFDELDKLLGLDPNITPIASLATVPRSTAPLRQMQVIQTSPDSEENEAAKVVARGRHSPAPSPSGISRKRRRTTSGTDDSIKQLLAEDMRNKQLYREEKLRISREKLEVLKLIAQTMQRK